MDIFFMALVVALVLTVLKNHEQRQRIALLGAHLQRFQLEKLIEGLTEGYLRAFGEADAQRRESVLGMLETTERLLSAQLDDLSRALQGLDPVQARISHLPIALPWATRWLPSATFDLREMVRLHATGVAQAIANADGLSRRDQAFRVSAELLLFQHTCHWYCRSRGVASARLLARHRTSHEQVVAAVSPATRQAYLQLIGG
ncbi:hypothetical protein ACFQNJ_02780 [Hydrogenophaga bisanensis]|uniref:LemA protein n=1 Tax=Hydrogenophaga bisanensis TaxID=439611 RepID=A0ABW2R644_9BURK